MANIYAKLPRKGCIDFTYRAGLFLNKVPAASKKIAFSAMSCQHRGCKNLTFHYNGKRCRIKVCFVDHRCAASRDFCPGGALAVKDGDAVVPILNEYVAKFHAAGLPIVATRDWHPEKTTHFKAFGGLVGPRTAFRGLKAPNFTHSWRCPRKRSLFGGNGRGRGRVFGFRRSGFQGC